MARNRLEEMPFVLLADFFFWCAQPW